MGVWEGCGYQNVQVKYGIRVKHEMKQTIFPFALERGTQRNVRLGTKNTLFTCPSVNFLLKDVNAVWVGARTSNLFIQSCTASFTTISGPTRDGQGCLELAKPRHRAPVLSWIFDAAARDHNDGAHLAPRSHVVTMQLHRTGGIHEVKAKWNVLERTRSGTVCVVSR